jgi:hypothetical protein
MEYIAIIGKNYKDCKAKQISLSGTKKPTKYTLVTKPNHTNGIPFSEVIETKDAKSNPNYEEIKKALSGIKLSEPVVEDKSQLEIEFEPVETAVEEKGLEFSEDYVDTFEDERELVEKVGPSEEPEVDELPPEPETEPEPVEETPEEVPVIDHVEELLEEEPEVEEEVVTVEDMAEDLPDIEEEPEVEPENEYIPEEEEVVITESEEEPEVEEEVVPETAPEEEESEIKPVNAPRGWHARNEFIDDAGNIFHKGKYVGKVGADE